MTTIACPECGASDYQRGEWREGNYEHICDACGQSWFPDIDYSKPVSDTHTPTGRGPLDDITIRYHAAMPKWCKLNGLEIKACPPYEGGFMVRRDQAEAIIGLLQLPDITL